MDFELDDEQLELQRVLRDLVDNDCPPSLVRSVAEHRPDAGDAVDVFWKTLVGMDLPGLAVPAEHGGTGATCVELAIVLEELGRGADPTPFLVTTSQYAPMVREVFPADRAGPLLAAVCGGATGAVVYADGASGTAQASSDGDGWRLSGRASYVMDADRADEVAVVASAGDELGVFVVPAAELRATRTTAFDATFHVCDVDLDGVSVAGERAVVGPSVRAAVDRALQEAVTGLAAVTVGACQRILELDLEHVKARKQFGVPIGSFQAVKHLAVDMFVAIQRARALVQFAALTIAEDDDRRTLAASMAKAAAGDAQRIVTRHGIQLFGGLGYTWENDLQLFVRRAKAGDLLLGTGVEHRVAVGRTAIGAEPEGVPA